MVCLSPPSPEQPLSRLSPAPSIAPFGRRAQRVRQHSDSAVAAILAADHTILRSEERTLETVDYLMRALASTEARAAALMGLPAPLEEAAGGQSSAKESSKPVGRRLSSVGLASDHQRSSDGRALADPSPKLRGERVRVTPVVELIAGREGLVQEASRAGMGRQRRVSGADARVGVDGGTDELRQGRTSIVGPSPPDGPPRQRRMSNGASPAGPRLHRLSVGANVDTATDGGFGLGADRRLCRLSSVHRPAVAFASAGNEGQEASGGARRLGRLSSVQRAGEGYSSAGSHAVIDGSRSAPLLPSLRQDGQEFGRMSTASSSGQSGPGVPRHTGFSNHDSPKASSPGSAEAPPGAVQGRSQTLPPIGGAGSISAPRQVNARTSSVGFSKARLRPNCHVCRCTLAPCHTHANAGHSLKADFARASTVAGPVYDGPPPVGKGRRGRP